MKKSSLSTGGFVKEEVGPTYRSDVKGRREPQPTPEHGLKSSYFILTLPHYWVKVCTLYFRYDGLLVVGKVKGKRHSVC